MAEPPSSILIYRRRAHAAPADGPDAPPRGLRRDQVLEAFDKAEVPFGAVGIDRRMRPRGGVAVLNALPARSPGLRMVLTNGSVRDPDARALPWGHGGEFVCKPFASESLLRAVASVLEGRDR